MCSATATGNVNSSSVNCVSHGGLIYNLTQELGVSWLTQRDCPFRMETPTMQQGIDALTTKQTLDLILK